jgi:RimJ/RimL family protein N-acetyltransferase
MINFNQNIILDNDLVLLRPLQPTDFEALLYYSETEPELWKYSLIPANGIENLKKYLEVAFLQRNQKTSYTFVVVSKKENKIVGMTRFYDIQEKQKTLQLGYTWYGKDYQGTNINKNCKYLLLEFAFETWNMERVEFRADANNTRSIQAMKSIGCTVEGILRSNVMKNETERRDSIVLSILKEEWYETVKENLSNKIK